MKLFEPGTKIHFIGIAGSGMSGIAKILISRGFQVSGSDEKESEALHSIATAGAKTYVGHSASHIEGADLVVISSAIPESNAELVAARSQGIEVLRRAEALARLLPGRFSIAVAGTHGKTTTSGMFAQLLSSLGRDPSYVIGSRVKALGESAAEGGGSEFIVEADESDGSFLHYRPNAAIITNIELDHVDNFANLEVIQGLFTDFIATIRDFVVVCGDDPVAASIQVPPSLHRISYGFAADCDLWLSDLHEGDGVSAKVRFRGEDLGRLSLAMPGRHNILNASAVLAASLAMGVGGSEAITKLGEFEGTERRFELKGISRGITIFDDYGHHPTEIRAVIEAARSRLATSESEGRLALIFQPHRFSRTAAFAPEFAAALSGADKTFLLDVYSAGESAIPGISSKRIVEMIPNGMYCESFEDAISAVNAWAKRGDVVITLGAGDVTKVGPDLVKALAAKA